MPSKSKLKPATVNASSTHISDDELENIESQKVADINIEFIYQPHTLILLGSLIAWLIYSCFTRDEVRNSSENYWNGIVAVFVAFIGISMMICSNGPFTRPHPVIWRIVLGVSIFYLMSLTFVLFQSYEDVRSILFYVYPELRNVSQDTRSYAEHCELNYKNIAASMDIFVVCHFLGWVMKALLVRHAGVLWLLSLSWELTELGFVHLLPNFAECWWDSIVLDLLICNGVGIHFGLYVCKKLEMRKYHWESVISIQGASKKLKRAVLQFTPLSWLPARWYDDSSTIKRYVALSFLCIFWQVNELNCFFIKHIFIIPTNHILNLYRIIMILLLTAPAVRQYYLFVTHDKCRRLGTHAWVFIAITSLESIVCIRHELALFKGARIYSIIIWLIAEMIFVFFGLWLVIWWKKYTNPSKKPINS